MKNIICICCPTGCHLSVDETKGFAVSGNLCKRGEIYGKQEIQDPRRIVTSTVAVKGGRYSRCPVKTSGTIPKAMMFDAMKTLDNIIIKAPIKTGQVIIKDICGSQVDFIATQTIEAR